MSVPHPRREKLFALAIVALRLINEAETTLSEMHCGRPAGIDIHTFLSLSLSLIDKQTRFFRHFSHGRESQVDSRVQLAANEPEITVLAAAQSDSRIYQTLQAKSQQPVDKYYYCVSISVLLFNYEWARNLRRSAQTGFTRGECWEVDECHHLMGKEVLNFNHDITRLGSIAGVIGAHNCRKLWLSE